MAEIVRKHIIFHGSVQGVGFRYRAFHAANRYGVAGFVMNEWDGTVVMEAEGEAEAIDRVIAEISRGTFVNIERMEVRSIPPENEKSFRIR